MRFRIKHTQKGYFAQVKTSWFSAWKRIGCQSDGFWLDREASDYYPLPTENDAIKRCLDYKEFASKSTPKPQYKDLLI